MISFPTILSFVALGLLVIGCQDEQNDSENAGGAGNQETCADLAQAECEASDVCTSFWAYEYEDGTFESKPDSKTFVACRDAGPDDDLCGDALTCGYETEGACWMFPTNCLPEGWTYLNCTQPCPNAED
jgi:hypothetical protein